MVEIWKLIWCAFNVHQGIRIVAVDLFNSLPCDMWKRCHSCLDYTGRIKRNRTIYEILNRTSYRLHTQHWWLCPADDSILVDLTSDDDNVEYRGLMQDFVDWCQRNHLIINARKTKETSADASLPPLPRWTFREWTLSNSELTGLTTMYGKSQSKLGFLRRLWSFGVRGPLLKTSVVAFTFLQGVVHWSSSITEKGEEEGGQNHQKVQSWAIL